MKQNIYIYDNFIDLINLIQYLIKNRIKPFNIKSNLYIPSLFDNLIYLKLDYDTKEFIRLIGKENFKIIYYVYLSNDENKELIMFYFALNSYIYKEKVIYKRNLNCVNKALKIFNYVKRENHRFKGFTRFKELKNNIWYAEINPDNNIIEILSLHFKKRLKNEIWIIKDINRKIISLYNKKEYIILNEEEYQLIGLEFSYNELEIEKLWKSFYHTIGIKERKNNRCRLNLMPKKYWPYIVEVVDEESS